MAKSKELSELTRNSIKDLSNAGLTQIKISKLLKVPQSTISDTLARFRTHETLKSLPRTGRPKKTSTRIDKRIVRIAEAQL